MRDFLEILSITVAMLILVIGGITGLLLTFDYFDCRGFAAGTGMQTKWEWGCYAKTTNGWVPKAYVFGQALEARVKDAK